MTKGIGGLADQVGMLRKLQAIQKDVLKAQKEIAKMTATGTAGDGAVTAVVSGDRRVQSITIRPEAADPDDVATLQDLVREAVNQGLEQLERKAAEKLGTLTGGLGVG